MKWQSGEAFIGTDQGVVKASAIRRVGSHRRWDAEGILAVRGVPWRLTPEKDQEDLGTKVTWLTEDEKKNLMPNKENARPQVRRTMLRKEDFFKHGFSEGCLGCQAIIAGQESRNHSEFCRKRMEDILSNTPSGSDRLKRYLDKSNEELARRVAAEVAEEEECDRKRVKTTGEPASSSGGVTSTKVPETVPNQGGEGSEYHPMPQQAKRPSSHEDMEPDKRRKDGEEEDMEVSLVERLMQEDFSWGLSSVSDLCEEELADQRGEAACPWYWDEHSGERLDPKLVAKAEKDELDRFQKMGVYSYIRREEALADADGTFVKVKWVRINKGTREKPKLRCRLVAQELALGQREDELFAGTPPLSAVKMAIHHAAQAGRGRKLMSLDVKCAFLYGVARRKIYIELPTGDPRHGSEYVGVLNKSLYGTRDAPLIWADEVRQTLVELGFYPSKLQPSVYYHRTEKILVVVHVDDFLISGTESQLKWIREALGQKYDVEGMKIGKSARDEHVMKFLNRTIHWGVDNVISYEHDPRHIEILLKEWGMAQCWGSSTVMSKDVLEKLGEGEKLNDVQGRRARRAIARINYLTLDRPDLAAASRLLSKNMSSPTTGTVRGVESVLRYLKTNPRCVQVLEGHVKGERQVIDVYTDSDWATDPKTRKSCSGGYIAIDGWVFSHWSKTQSNIALSSGEAELNSVVKGLVEAVGLKNLYSELFDEDYGIALHVDASACRGMVLRTGVGKIKHLSTKQLWAQAAVSSYGVKVIKIPRAINGSDVLTHVVSGPHAVNHVRRMGYRFC